MIVGLTGGIASGKTYCTDYLAQQFAIRIIDADLIAREVVAPGSEGLAAISAAFGHDVLHADGSLNRGKMRQIMLADDQARLKLNAIIHPRVRHTMLARLQSDTPSDSYQIMSVPLLLENGLQQYSDVVVVIDVTKATQLRRLQQRDQTDSQAAQRMLNVQMSRAQRLCHAHFIIDNNGTKHHTQQQLRQLHQQLMALHRY